MIITFVANSEIIYLYQYNCIKQIQGYFKNSTVDIYITQENKQRTTFKYKWKLIKWIDGRLSITKQNALEQVNLLNNELKLTYIKQTDHLKVSNWIILLNSNLDFHLFENKFSNGILRLKTLPEYCYFQSINNNPHTSVRIEKFNTDTQVWEQSFMNLRTEKGIINNLNKVLLNYSVFLPKCMNSNVEFYEENNNTRNINILKLTYYYLNLISFLFSRKINNKEENWKIVINKVHFINQPDNSFWADPFIVVEKERLYVFFEELDKKTNLGHLSVVELDPDFKIIRKEIILNKEYHLSFPNIFSFQGDYYMIPESSGNNTLSLYKCKNFPHLWQHEMNLFENIKLIDTIWIYHEGLYWLFANKIEEFETENNEKLYIFYSESLFSTEWVEHPENPVIVDAKRARNAGQIYKDSGKLYRPSQNCFTSYGSNIMINEIIKLTTTEYIEKPIEPIIPLNGYIGLHTFNSNNGFQVFDLLKSE